jgi:hypothetical protein
MRTIGTDDGRSTTDAAERPAAGTDPTVDPTVEALDVLIGELGDCLARLEHARDRARELRELRLGGRSWLDIVSHEQRPLVVESISSVLASLSGAGSRWRREQALALQSEDVSINRIAAMFGVTRQRISALVRGRDDDPGQ